MISVECREEAITDLVEMVKFRTISGEGAANGSYDACGAWLMRKLEAIGLEVAILPESVDHKPIIVGKWEGTSPELPSILLNSHYDVVPVAEELWSVPCFDGLRRDGRVYGRGTQDM